MVHINFLPKILSRFYHQFHLFILVSITYYVIFYLLPKIPFEEYAKKRYNTVKLQNVSLAETNGVEHGLDGYNDLDNKRLADKTDAYINNSNVNRSTSSRKIVPVLNSRNDAHHISNINSENDSHQRKQSKLKYKIHSYKDTKYSGFDITKARLSFLPNFKSPCWVEEYEGNDVYKDNMYVKHIKNYPFWQAAGKRLKQMDPKGVRIRLDYGDCKDRDCRLRCLPYFMLIGVAKSATTDISFRTHIHPKVHGGLSKELYWWTQFRFPSLLGSTLGDYADLFDKGVSKMIKQYTRKRDGVTYYDSVVGEFTSMTFFDFAHWRKDPLNVKQREPKNTVANDIYKILPNIRLIVTLRNPTTRLYSSYHMFNKHNGSPEDFHMRVLGSIWWWKTCVKLLPERNCAYGSPPNMPPVYDLLGKRTRWWRRDRNYTGEIRHGMYGLMVNEWLSIFPRKHILFLRQEDYAKNITFAFNEQIFPFLGLKPLKNKRKLKRLNYKKKNKTRVNYKPMLAKTRGILDSFYAPFNELLARALGHEKWLWKDTAVKVQ